MEVVVEMLKNKQAGILRASRALLGSTAECRESHRCLAQQHRTREKRIPPKKGGKRIAGQTEATDMASRSPGWSQSDSLTTSNGLRRLRGRLKPRSYLSSALVSSVWHAQFTKRVAK